MKQQIEAFFTRYEAAIIDSDATTIGSLYADIFMFAGPQGVQSVRKEDFLRVLPQRKAWFSSIGLVTSHLGRVQHTILDAKYSLAKTEWKMTFEKNGHKKQFEASATYVLEQKGDSLQIVFQIDHQDLSARVKELGLA